MVRTVAWVVALWLALLRLLVAFLPARTYVRLHRHAAADAVAADASSIVINATSFYLPLETRSTIALP